MSVKRCGCRICKFKCLPVSFRIVNSHLQKYGECTEEHLPQSSPRQEYRDDGLFDNGIIAESYHVRIAESDDGFEGESDEDDGYLKTDSESENQTNVDIPPYADHNNMCGNFEESGGGWSDDSEGIDSDASAIDSNVEDTDDDFSCSDNDDDGGENPDNILKCDNDIYDSFIAVKTIPKCGISILQWLALNFNIFTSHPSISKNAFSKYLQLQSKLLESPDISLPVTYREARKLIDPYLVKRKIYHACVNDCVLFRNCEKYAFEDLYTCPTCGEQRFINNAVKKPVARKRFSYIPVGPRLSRIYGDVNLAQLVQSHSTSIWDDIDGDDVMWDIHGSPAWNEIYSSYGFFAGDKLGISFAFEMDGVNPFHNIGIPYSMTPMMLTILNLPRHMRNAFGNIQLIGIIPGNGRGEAAKLEPYLEVLVDELLHLTTCTAYSAYHNAPVDVKVKLLLYILDYPGFSKLFNLHGSGSLCGCHWCFLRGERCAQLDKVIYPCNRHYLEKENPLRKDNTNVWKSGIETCEKPKLRQAKQEECYRQAYENSKNKTQANMVATATGCKSRYAFLELPDHNRCQESLPDSCHTIKDVVQNIMNLLTNRNTNLNKVLEAERNMNRLHICDPVTDILEVRRRLGMNIDLESTDENFMLCNTTKRRKVTKKKTIKELEQIVLPFALTNFEIQSADARAQNISVPLGFGLKPSPYISKSGCLKSHDWKQLASEGILKFCLKDALSSRCRRTLFLFFDCISDLCQESHTGSEVDDIERKLNEALALLERDFPISLQNITTHLMHHIPDGIRKFGPVYGTWMYVFERFNSWLCKRTLNMRYPEATAVETYLIFDWCNFMQLSGRMPPQKRVNLSLLSVESDLDDEFIISSLTSSANIDKSGERHSLIEGKEFKPGKRYMKSIHEQCQVVICTNCFIQRYYRHKETDSRTRRQRLYNSSQKELSSLHGTKSSFVCVEFDRGPQQQKVMSGKFVRFGHIKFFIVHNSCSNLACVEWYETTEYNRELKMWYTDYPLKTKKQSYILTNRLSHPLVTAVENGKLWFLNARKASFFDK